MRIVLFGTGTIGRAVIEELGSRHEVIGVTRNNGEHRADIADPASIETLLKKTGKVDALIACAGKGKFSPLTQMTPESVHEGLRYKLLGQVNVILAGVKHLNDGGSVTVTTGLLTEHYIREASPVSMANGALEAFVKAAAIEMPRGMRVNVVSPGVVAESGPVAAFRAYEPVPVKRVALAYVRSVEGAQTGQVYRAW